MCIDKMRYIMIGCALALIALAGCKTPELSMDERISLPESGEMGMNDTTFVKPLSWDVFFQDTLLRGYVDVALRNNHSFRQSMERIAMSRAALQRAKGLLLPDVNLNIGASVNIRWMVWGIARRTCLLCQKISIYRTLTGISA